MGITIKQETGVGNRDRAANARRGLEAYAGTQSAEAGLRYIKTEGWDTVIADLMCDLMHLARFHKADPAVLVARATNNFEYESGTPAHREAWWHN
jgi:hypothetical protein